MNSDHVLLKLKRYNVKCKLSGQSANLQGCFELTADLRVSGFIALKMSKEEVFRALMKKEKGSDRFVPVKSVVLFKEQSWHQLAH